jgi:RNA polymerase sigma-70 factor (ECF subfamily)
LQSNDSQPAETRIEGNFPSTQWSHVARAANSATAGRFALGELLTTYLPPLRNYLVSKRGLTAADADDALQGFVVNKVLEQRILARAEKGRGKFRSFIIKALDHYIIDQIRQGKAKARSGVPGISSEALADIEDPSADVHGGFNFQWARTVLDQAIELMRMECQHSNRPELWGVFEARILQPTLEASRNESYAELAKRFGFASATQACNLLVTANRMFRRALREIIAQYEPNEKNIDREIIDLREALSIHGSR